MAAKEGNTAAQTALDVYYYRIKKYIGAYAAAPGGVDIMFLPEALAETAVNGGGRFVVKWSFLGFRFQKK